MKALSSKTDSYVELNGGESSVYKCIATGDDFEDRPTVHQSDIFVDGFTCHNVAGYLSALSQKGVINECVLPNGDTAWQSFTTDDLDRWLEV